VSRMEAAVREAQEDAREATVRADTAQRQRAAALTAAEQLSEQLREATGPHVMGALVELETTAGACTSARAVCLTPRPSVHRDGRRSKQTTATFQPTPGPTRLSECWEPVRGFRAAAVKAMAEEAMVEVGANVGAMRELKGLVALLRSSSTGAVAYAHEALATMQQRVGRAEAEREQAVREAAAAVAAAQPSEQLLATEREKRAEAERQAERAEMQVAVGDVKVGMQWSFNPSVQMTDPA